jgi:hypothetical protein
MATLKRTDKGGSAADSHHGRRRDLHKDLKALLTLRTP